MTAKEMAAKALEIADNAHNHTVENAKTQDHDRGRFEAWSEQLRRDHDGLQARVRHIDKERSILPAWKITPATIPPRSPEVSGVWTFPIDGVSDSPHVETAR